MVKKELILKYALQNAAKFNGKASPGAVVGKVLAEQPELRKEMKSLSKEIAAVIKEVNSMKPEEQIEKLKQIDPSLLEEKKHEKRTELPELKGAVKGKVVTRIPPEPSKYNHIGHALSFLINYLYAKKYDGKCILRFEDTNPATAKQEYVDAMKEDVLEYVDIKPDKIVFVSDDMPKFYEYAEKLISEGKAYVCFCEREKMQELRHKGKACVCRENPKEKHMEEWKNMLDGDYKDGECSLRLKIDLEADNHVMRDPVVFRICTTPHYRQKDKYVVWPLYDFENAIEEHLCGVTHILRSSEFGQMRVELQEYIKKILGLNQQVAVQYGRFNVVGAVTQGREIRKLIEEKKVMGWDDPILVTLKALKRRGILTDSFYELVHEVGLSKNQTNLDFNVIAAINRRLLDPIAYRYFFVWDPVEIEIEGAPEQDIELNLHPDNKKGGRKFKTGSKFYITKDDFESFKEGKLYRLMDCLNFTRKGKKFLFDSVDHKKYKEKGERIIHWLPKGETVNVEVLMPDKEIRKGLGEKGLKSLETGEICQLERFAFVKLDSKDKNTLKFWFTHK